MDYVSSINTAMQALHGNNPARALEAAKTAVGLSSTAEANFLLGMAHVGLGEWDEAAAAFGAAADLHKDGPESPFHQGVALMRAGREAEAVEAFRETLRRSPGLLEAQVNLSGALLQAGQAGESLAAAEEALAKQPDNPGILANMAGALIKLDRPTEALAKAERAAKLAPDAVEVLLTLGHTRSSLAFFAAAEEAYERAHRLAPERADIATHLGDSLAAQGRENEALALYDNALTLDPNYREARVGKGFILLRNGQWREGLALYEHRSSRSGENNRTNFADRQRWRGEPLEGRSLLVAWEQGFGDTVMFARYLPMLDNITFSCQPALESLMRESFPGISVVSKPPKTDLWVPLPSLPLLLDVGPESPTPYLKAPSKPKLQKPSGRLCVGLSWIGKGAKTLSPDLLAPLFSVEGVTFYGLQLGEGEALQGKAENIDPLLEGFSSTAAVIGQLDLVISVDTVTLHLAGALGVPAWGLLAHVADWRWFKGTETSPWYPSVKLFRQETPGDWAGVMERVRSALAQEASNS